MNIGTILWDFDGTLAHRPGLWSQCLAELANAAGGGKHFDRALFAAHLNSGFPWHAPEQAHSHLQTPSAWWSALEPVFSHAFERGAQFDANMARLLAAQVRERYLDPSGWQVFDDVHLALAALTQAGWSHVVLSNHVPELPALMDTLGLAHHFQGIISSASSGYEKPHPQAFAAALRRVPAGQRCVMVGDSLVADVLGARAAGLEAMWVRGRDDGEERNYADLTMLVAHLAQSGLIENFNKRRGHPT